MDKNEIIKIFGLPEDATDEQVADAVKAGAQAIEQIAAEREKAAAAEQTVATANAECETAKKEADDAKAALENERQAHASTKTALANEQAAHQRTKELKTKSVTIGLANQQPLEGSEARMALVNECQREMKCDFDTAWAAAKAKNPDLFK